MEGISESWIIYESIGMGSTELFLKSQQLGHEMDLVKNGKSRLCAVGSRASKGRKGKPVIKIQRSLLLM